MALSSAEDLKRPNGWYLIFEKVFVIEMFGINLVFPLARQGYSWGEDTEDDYSKAPMDTLSSSAHPPFAPTPFYPHEYR